MKKACIIIICIFLVQNVYGQENLHFKAGNVTYITSNNVYVKFENTDGIKPGDTLFHNFIVSVEPCLIVVNKSSTSCVCRRINDCPVELEDEFLFQFIDEIEKPLDELLKEEPLDVIQSEEVETSAVDKLVNELADELLYKERIRGRISASSYSNFSNNYDNRHRTMLRFNFDAKHINNSKLSLSSYVNYRREFRNGSSNIFGSNNSVRVYNLALDYNVDPSWRMTFGRKINNKISSLGAIDGLQTERQFKNTYVGAVIGLRPDISSFNFNPKLLQYGAYVGLRSNSLKMVGETTFGLLEQRNGGAVDRRYAYFQHSSQVARKINLFGSFEMDIFSNMNGVTGAKPRLTNLFLSTRYRFNKKLFISVAYDSRRRIIFYETLKTDLERLLDENEARQGFRFRLNLRPLRFLNAGLGYSIRFQNNSENKSNNLNGFLGWSKVAGIGGRINIGYNWNKSNYLLSKVISVRFNRSIITGKVDGDVYFRNVNYEYLQNEIKDKQKYYGIGLSYRMSRKWSLSLMGEKSLYKGDNNYRLNTKLIRRFK